MDNNMPLELFLHILKYIDVWKDIQSIKACCKRFNNIIKANKDKIFDDMNNNNNSVWVSYDDLRQISKSGKIIENTENVYEKAVQVDGLALEFVPFEMKTKKICEMATKQNMCSYRYVRGNCITENMCIELIKNNLCKYSRGLFNVYNTTIVAYFDELPEEIKTLKVRKEFVKKYPAYLSGVSQYDFDEDFYEEIVKIRPSCIEYIPNNFRTKNICYMAFEMDNYVYKYIPDDMMTECMFIELLKKGSYGSYNLDCVPKHRRTVDICMIAVDKNGKNIMYVPENILTEEMCYICVKKNALCLELIPCHFKTKKICEMAFNERTVTIKYIPEHLITGEMCMIVARTMTLLCIPLNLRTEEICKLSVAFDGINLKFVAPNLKTEQLCLIAVKNSKDAIKYVPNDVLTKEMCEIAIKKSFENFKLIPEVFREYAIECAILYHPRLYLQSVL